MKTVLINRIFLGFMAAMIAGHSMAQESVDESTVVREQLEQAKAILANAQKEAEQIVRNAQTEANLMLSSSAATSHDLVPLEIKNEKISVEVNGGTLQNIIEKIMPINWRVLIDSEDLSIKERRFQFVSTRSREQSLNDLLAPIGFKHQYFFNLKDSEGQPSPLLVVSAD